MGPLMDKFKNTNYMLWQFKVEMMLKAKELWGLIEKIKTEVKPDEADIIAIATCAKKENPSVKLARQSPSNN
jgi:hypothetical protein